MSTIIRAGLGAVLVATALAGCGGSSGISAQGQRDFIAGCTSKGASQSMCGCIFARLSGSQGYNTDAKMRALLNGGSVVAVVQQDAIGCK